MVKILVSGGAGFIGSHVVDRYLAEGHKVVVIDDLSTGLQKNVNPKAKFYQMDIRSKEIMRIFKEEKFDIVNHHAAQIDVRTSLIDPANDVSINVLGSINILEACVKNGVKRFIFISSGGAICGDSANIPTPENTAAMPLSPYAMDKKIVEDYLAFYSRLYGLKYIVLRYANVYGQRQHGGEAGVVAIFAQRMLANKECTIFGNGNQTRDYIFVGDVVEANVLALVRGNCEICNIGTMKEVSVNELFLLMKANISYKKNARYETARPGEVLRSCLDISLAKKILGWKPNFDLSRGIDETIKWFRNQKAG